MTAIEFVIQRTPSPTPHGQRQDLVAAARFGEVFTDHMVTIRHDDARGWHDAGVRPLMPIPLHPATTALHYAQEVFEGLKAFRHPDGTVSLFRPRAHAARFNRSLRRMAMPDLPEDVFVHSLELLVQSDMDWVPSAQGAGLYLRPFAFATDEVLGAGRPSTSYLFVVIASPSPGRSGSRTTPISVWLSREYARAVPGGTGAAKAGANYASALLGLQEAKRHGCDTAVWLDAFERRWVEEADAANLFFVYGDATKPRLVTPPLTGTFLPGITRDCILQLAPTLGIHVTEKRICAEEWRQDAEHGRLTEVFICGTATGITPVGRACHASAEWTIGDGVTGPVTQRLRDEFTAIQHGTRPDRFGWLHSVHDVRPGLDHESTE
jgi:branched-chain amino acid aminotransferase